MKASAFEYRFRLWIIGIILLLGFSAPWAYLQRTNDVEITRGGANVWIILSTDLSLHLDPTKLLLASNIILWIAIILAALGAWLRTWGAAYLDSTVVQSGVMHTSESSVGFLEVGPFRYLRNPLYLGTFFHVLALTILMPVSGAIFTLVAIIFFELRLVDSEESFLLHKIGKPFEKYCERVPRFLPGLRDKAPASSRAPLWGQAFLGEVYMWGVLATFVAASAFPALAYTQSYAVMGILISLGVSLLLRGLLLKPRIATT
jgi:protein-S-isoprenylcysteine O-methyltransferase Ste14